MNKQLFFGQYKRDQQLFRRHRTCCPGLAGGQGAGDSRNRARQGARRKSSRRPTRIRSAAIRKRCATICARRCGCSRKPASRCATASWSTPDRKAMSASRSWSTDPSCERVMLFYKPSLERLGITVSRCARRSMRSIENRLRSWDFDMIIGRHGASRCRRATSSANTGARRRRTRPGSRNIIGIKNPAIDELIERVIFAKDRDDLVAATKALDRVLLWNHYVVPQWNYPKVAHRALGPFQPGRSVAEIRPSAFPTLWWYDAEKAARNGKRVLKELRAWRDSLAGTCSVSVSARWPAAASRRRCAEQPAPRRARPFGVRRTEIPRRFSQHFDYVNVACAKGRDVFATRRRGLNVLSTFNSLNAFIVKGEGANGMELTFASLMARAVDEPDAMYGLVARIGADFPGQTGVSVSGCGRGQIPRRSEDHAHDVAFSLKMLKEQGPSARPCSAISRRANAEAADDASCASPAASAARDVPLYVAAMPIFSKRLLRDAAVRRNHARSAAGLGALSRSAISRQSLHRIRTREGLVGREASGLPRPLQFRYVRYEYYRDRDVAFEGFTGNNYLFREEFTSRIWATRYDFPAHQGRPRQARGHAGRAPSGAQGWLINTRRDKFRDPRVREALTIAFDFEWTNKTIMYGSYQRTHSVFQNSDMMARGSRRRKRSSCSSRSAARCPRKCSAALRAAGVRRIGAGSQAAAQGRELLNDAGLVVKDGKRLTAERRSLHDRIPARRALVRAAPRAVHQESWHARHRGHTAHGRCRSISGAGGGFRLRHDHRAFIYIGDSR